MYEIFEHIDKYIKGVPLIIWVYRLITNLKNRIDCSEKLQKGKLDHFLVQWVFQKNNFYKGRDTLI